MLHAYKDLLELAGLSGAGRDSSRSRTTVYRIPLDETLTNTYFFFNRAFLLFRTIYLLLQETISSTKSYKFFNIKKSV